MLFIFPYLKVETGSGYTGTRVIATGYPVPKTVLLHITNEAEMGISADFSDWRLLSTSPIRSQFWHTKAVMVWHQLTCMTNYVDQQTLNPDDDYVLPYRHLWMFDVLVCPLSFPVAAARLWNSFPSHVTAVPSLSIFCYHV